MRGRTTQKRVSSTRKAAALLTSSAVATTRVWSSLSAMVFTSPMSTSLYLIFVLPASSPSAVRKEIVTVGPRSRIAFAASHAPTTTATNGMIQMSCGVQRRGGAATASGRSGRFGSRRASGMLPLRGVPDQSRVEALGREHRQHDHRAKRDRARSGPDVHQTPELDERGEDRC